MRPPLPTPAAAREYLAGFAHVSGFGVQDFLDSAVDRILTSLSLVPPLGPESRILEIGAQPYLMTALLQRHFPAQVQAVNEDDRGGGEDGRFDLRHRSWTAPVAIEYDRFNIEFDRFPYDDAYFDVVFLCEVIEHLAHDPVHAVNEINRVLKHGGSLILSTPNAFRLENLWKIIRGRNLYPPYSGWGVTSRHNREFTCSELGRLLEANGFTVETNTSHADPGYRYAPALRWVARSLDSAGVGKGLLDNIHVRAFKRGPARYAYPADMFFDVQAYGRVSESVLDMESAPESQLGRGVYEREIWPPAVRWTERESMFRLRLENGHRRAAIRFFSGPAELNGPIEGELATAGVASRFSVDPGRWETVRLELPDGLEKGILELQVTLDKSWTPSDLCGESDTRELGVAVRRVWLE